LSGHSLGAKILHPLAALDQDLVCPIKCLFDHLARWSIGWECLHDSVESKHKSLKFLEQGVMQLPRDPFPLFHLGSEPFLNLYLGSPEAVEVKQPKGADHERNNRRRVATTDDDRASKLAASAQCGLTRSRDISALAMLREYGAGHCVQRVEKMTRFFPIFPYKNNSTL
jgi:hypothetical protein